MLSKSSANPYCIISENRFSIKVSIKNEREKYEVRN